MLCTGRETRRETEAGVEEKLTLIHRMQDEKKFIFIEQLPVVFSPCSKGFGEICHVAGSAESALWRTQALEMGFSAKQLFVSINTSFTPSFILS